MAMVSAAFVARRELNISIAISTNYTKIAEDKSQSIVVFLGIVCDSDDGDDDVDEKSLPALALHQRLGSEVVHVPPNHTINQQGILYSLAVV